LTPFCHRKMRVRATASSLLIAVLCCLSAVLPTRAQRLGGPTWTDGYGKIRSRADLDEILKQHKLWLDSKEKSGARADFRFAHLSGWDLGDAVLRGADLGNAYLTGAHLSGADLTEANLSDADLTDAELGGANLSNADLISADLVGADLMKADLSGAYLSDAKLCGTVFQPRSLPPVEGLNTAQSVAGASCLERMMYNDNPGLLTELQKSFRDTGYREQERAITCALNRRGAERDSGFEGLFKWLAFDLTCEYGLSPGRPLRIVLWLWLFFSFIYAAFMHLPGTSGIYFMGTRVWRGKTNTQGIQVRPEPILAAKPWKKPLLWLRREWRVLRAAMFFSLMSAFNIGFRDINFGRWLRLLTKREYDLKAVGWARTVSGFQSLLSVYLIALWVLSYFGRPFG